MALVLGPSAQAFAANGDCGQPVSDGANPVASDCLFILSAAVGVQTCDPTCACDVNGAGGTTATDALACLNASVGIPGLLNCACGPDGDDFNDNAKDPTRWGTDEVTGNGSLSESITRLEYHCSSGTSYDEAYRPWIKSQLPYDADWETQTDVRNISDLNVSGQVSSVGIEIRGPNDDGDYIYAELYASTLNGLPANNGFYGELGFGQGNYAFVDTNDLNLTAGAVRLSFDAASKVVTLYYDYPGGDYSWIEYGSFGIDGNGGTDGNGDWNLAPGDEMTVRIYGYSEQMAVPIARIYADNFSITGAR